EHAVARLATRKRLRRKFEILRINFSPFAEGHHNHKRRQSRAKRSRACLLHNLCPVTETPCVRIRKSGEKFASIGLFDFCNGTLCAVLPVAEIHSQYAFSDMLVGDLKIANHGRCKRRLARAMESGKAPV